MRALARGEYGEWTRRLRASSTTEILPAALSVSKSRTSVKVVLHDVSSDELIAGLHNATLELAIMVEPTGEQTVGSFEVLRADTHGAWQWPLPSLRWLKSVGLKKIAAEPLIGLRRKDYSEYNRILERLFPPSPPNPTSQPNATAPVR